MRHTRGKGQKG